MHRYVLYEELGAGGFGRVHRAERQEEDGTATSGFAVKLLRDERRADADAVARFSQEVRLLQDKLSHENVLPVVARNLSADPPWFAMPLAESTLERELASGRWADVDWVKRVFRDVLRGVGHAHAAGVLHRDLKPANVLIVGGVPKVADFGIGKQLDAVSSGLTVSRMRMGTEPYMAPECFHDVKRAKEPADVYALGKLLCEMLTGEVPDVGPPDMSTIPTEFKYFIHKCCSRDPADRFPTAGEALTAFEILVAGAEIVDPPIEAAEKLIQEWLGAFTGGGPDVTQRLHEHLLRHSGEEELYSRIVPRLPDGLVIEYLTLIPDGFTEVLSAYDAHVQGALNFEYCDVVADFYRSVWDATSDPDHRRLILRRLLTMGPSHNRWHVGEVVASMFSGIRDTGTALLAHDVIGEVNPRHAAWFTDYVQSTRVLAPIADAINEAVRRQYEPPPVADVPGMPF